MPELPEVESVVRKLKLRVLNRVIKNVTIRWDNIIEYPKKELFISNIRNQEIIDIKRRGKWIIMELTNYYLLVHLRMEGKFFIKHPNDEVDKHEHVMILLDNDEELRYRDTRKFGKMLLIEKDKLVDAKPMKNMGVEPFDEGFTKEYLVNKFKKKTIPIKSSLLDQSIVTGIGNIYVDEILFSSRINPSTKTNEVNAKEISSIIENTKKIMDKAIEYGGTKIRTYTSLDGEQGHYQNYLNVHTKVGKPCPICNTTILKTKIGGRGTYYCPKCQLEKK